MSEDRAYITVDLGAESGRVMVGTLRDGRMELETVHRFVNSPVRTPDGLHWDVPRIYSEILSGMHSAAARHGDAIACLGIDSWACDYGLLDRDGRLLGMPYHYRDSRTDGVREEVARWIPAAEQYSATGIAQLAFNTLYQLAAQKQAGDPILEVAASLLLIPDLLHFWLTGDQSTERTNASTTGVLGVDGRWAFDLLERLELPAHIFMPPMASGTILGGLRRQVQEETGVRAAMVVLPATHDTASAVAAIPALPLAAGMSRAYISSGTWSLLGLELDHPILSEDARRAGFTNEGGVGGTYRFLTNIMGLWLVQECRRSWARHGRDWTYEELSAAAADIASPGVIIDVDDSAFLHPDDMPSAIARQLQSTGQPALEDPVLAVRAILESLALAYRLALEVAERLAGTSVDTIHVVGGGARNSLLCQLTASACGRPVLAGPVEATALGNALTQALGMGDVHDLAEIHSIARSSADVAVYEPGEIGDWNERTDRLKQIRSRAYSAAANKGA